MSDVIQNVKIRYIIEDADLSKVDASLNKLTAEEAKLKEQLKQVDAQAKATNKTLQEESVKSAQSVNASGKSFDDLSSKVKNLSNQIPGAFQVEQVLGFAKAATTATTAVSGTSAAMNVLKVAFASTGIGALVIALVSLVAYFQKTDEGATKLEGIMGALGAAMDEVTGFIAEFGSKVFTAFESVENFQDGLSDLGEFLLNNLINRFKAFLVIGDATIKFLTGDFKGASKTAADAVIQFTTGIEGGTDKLSAMADRMAAAAKEAYEYAIKLDAVNDAQREFNVTVSENNIRIVELIRQSKNHTLSIQERIDKLQEANKLDEANLQGQLKIENQRLALIQERNRREQAAINQRKADLIAELNDENTKIKRKEEIQKQLLSINDELNEEEANQQIKINGLRQQSVALQERNNNSIAALTEEGIQKRLALIKTAGTAEETIYKEQYANREIDEKTFQEGIIQSQLDSLYTQKTFLEQLGRDTVEIDKSIAEILAKQRGDADKAKLAAENKLSEEQKQKWAEDAKFYSDLSKKTNDDDVKAKKEAEAKKAAIQQQSTTLLTTIANGFFQLQKDNLNNELSVLQYNQAQELAAAGENEQAKAAINAKFAKETAEIKRKQAVADKEQAIFNIGISTASAVIKQLAATPLPAGGPLIALVAAIGAAQLAFAVAKPIPKFFNKGTKGVPGTDTTRDSVYAMLTPGEGVMPVDRMKEYRPAFDAIFDRKIPADLINAIAMNPDVINSSPHGAFDIAPLHRELKELNKGIQKIKTFEVNMDAKGFKSYLKGENSKTQIENNYARIK
jgi:hypothetical protein